MAGADRPGDVDGDSVKFRSRWALGALTALVWTAFLATPSSTVAGRERQSQDLAKALSEGLAVWRLPDKKGASCASCHSPDGIELAYYNFDDPTVRRRAYPHVGLRNADRIVRFVHALREFYGIVQPRDPVADRPLQPGGTALAGSSPAERDLAFGKTLPSHLPALMTGRINSVAQAKAARDQVVKLDVHQVKIGFELNRLSEDRFNGKEHATVANWIADTALPFPRERLIEIEDTYLADPTDANLKALDEAIIKESGQPQSQADQLAVAKYRALLYLQHAMRMESLRRPTWMMRGPVAFAEFKQPMLPNPMWEVAEVGRMYLESPGGEFGLPEDVMINKNTGPSFVDQMKQLRLGWFWAGWMADQGLQRTSHLPETRRADYFSMTLLEDGPYPLHCAFMLTKKLATQSFVKEAWLPGPLEQHVVINYSFLVLRDNLKNYEPASGEHRKLFRQFVCNSFRMNLLLLADELERKKYVTYQKEPVQQQIRLAGEYFAVADPANAKADSALIKRVSADIKNAANKAVPGGGGVGN
jgi:hypothetical protein